VHLKGAAVDTREIARLADRIAEGRRSRKVMDFLAADTAALSEADSYKVQFAVHDRLTADGKDRMAGWKVALTLPSQYEPMKLSGPVFAGIYQSGVRPSGAVFEKGWPIKAGIECEMVAKMGKDVPKGGTAYTAETIKPFVSNFYCGAEVVENRYGDASKVSGPGRIADDVLQAACIVGTEVKDWKKVDFAGLRGRSEFDGKEIGAGPGTNVMGSALISLAWLANKLIEHGKHLSAGDVILTGSVHPPVFLPGPGTAKTEFVGLGGTETTYR
jgi:2-oxo-3-hexenedioate decarboxylase/2-keto-4-pentenoate hydratase